MPIPAGVALDGHGDVGVGVKGRHTAPVQSALLGQIVGQAKAAPESGRGARPSTAAAGWPLASRQLASPPPSARRRRDQGADSRFARRRAPRRRCRSGPSARRARCSARGHWLATGGTDRRRTACCAAGSCRSTSTSARTKLTQIVLLVRPTIDPNRSPVRWISRRRPRPAALGDHSRPPVATDSSRRRPLTRLAVGGDGEAHRRRRFPATASTSGSARSSKPPRREPLLGVQYRRARCAVGRR